MSEGGLKSFGDALKAFRRSVYQCPFEWTAVVLCASTAQRNAAFSEARAMMEASSLPVERIFTSNMTIHTARGGTLRFVEAYDLPERLRGIPIPQVICLFTLPASLKEQMESLWKYQGGPIDQKFHRWDEATL